MLPTNAKARKALPVFTFLMEYFPDSFIEMVKVAVAGNEQHNPGEPLHWERGKSTDQMDCALRHMMDYGRGEIRDTDGQYHLAKAMWRLGAELQLLIEDEARERMPGQETELPWPRVPRECWDDPGYGVGEQYDDYSGIPGCGR